MSLKTITRLLLTGTLVALSATAWAGGPGVMVPPAPVDYSGVYIEGDAGWAQVNWADFWAGALNSVPIATTIGNNLVTIQGGVVGSHGESGFTWGGDLGYQFNRYFSAEAGWYRLATVSGNHSRIAVIGNSDFGLLDGLRVYSWFVYFAGKVAIPVADDVDIFGKAGVAWRKLNYSGAGTSLAVLTAVFHDTHYSKPFFAFGAQWWIDQNWSANIQYMVVPGYYRAVEVAMQAPKANLVVGGIGYKFAV